VSLNNRIYLRDHLSPGYSDDARPTVPDQVRTRTITHPRFSDGAEPRSRSRVSTSDTFQLYDIPRRLDLDKGNGDADGKADGTDILVREILPAQAAIRFQRI
jgi:hypothetical protein